MRVEQGRVALGLAISEIAPMLRTGREADGNTRFIQAIDHLAGLLDALGASPAAHAIHALLGPIVEAQERKDWIRLADLLAYELGPAIAGTPPPPRAETVQVISETGVPVQLWSSYDPVAEAALQCPASVAGDTAVFLGIAGGHLTLATLAAHPQIRRAVLIDRDPARARAAAARIGSRALVDVLDTPSLPPDVDPRAIAIVPHPPSFAAHPTWYGRAKIAIATAGASAARTARRDRLRILVLASRFFAQDESARGFAQLGHDVTTFDYKAHTDDDLLGELQRVRPDLVVSINMHGLDRSGLTAAVLARVAIPLAIWFVDSPDFLLFGEAAPPRELCHLFVWDRAYVPALAALGYRTTYLPLAADPALADAATRSPDFESPLAFVGSSMVDRVRDDLAPRVPGDAATRALVDRAVAVLHANRGHQLAALDAATAHHDRDPRARAAIHALAIYRATLEYRARVLAPLVPLGLQIYGDPAGWQTLLGVTARPDVSYFRELPSVYASAAINVNATSMQMPEGVNQRVFDVPLCGGFLLTDRQAALADLFDDDEVARYDGPDDIAERARFYLAHPPLRAELAPRARTRVLAHHLYRHRLATLVATIFD